MDVSKEIIKESSMSQVDSKKRQQIQQSILQGRKGFENLEPVNDVMIEKQAHDDALKEALANAPIPSMEFRQPPPVQPQQHAQYQEPVSQRKRVQTFSPPVQTAQQQAQQKGTETILNRLKERFGLNRLPTHVLNIDEFAFRLQAINKQRLCFAAGMADLLTVYTEEFKRTFDTALAACYVTHINDEPLWLAMGVEPAKNVVITDPDNPPMSIAKMAHARFFDFLNTEGYDTLPDAIVKAYDSNIEPHARTIQKIINSDATDGRIAYVCPEDGCTYEILEFPSKYHCKYHGCEMIPKVRGDALPLE
jgi:hypothetical protein